MAIGFVLVIVFACIYVYSFRNARGRMLLIMAQIAIIAVFTFRYNPGFLYLCFYPAPIIGLLPSVRKMAVPIAALVVFLLSVYWDYRLEFTTNDILQVLPAAIIMLVMPMAFRISRRASQLREQLQLANEEIARMSKNEERQRISRDLHDTLGHTLSLITLKSELAEKLIMKNPERAVQEVKDIQATSRAALKQVRELVSGMNAVTVRDEISNAKQILAAANVALRIKGGFSEDAASPLIDNLLGMCLREAVTNVVKHSRARTCTIEQAEDEASLKLAVSDDGQGMDADAAALLSGGSGLKGMRERLKLVEGDVHIESARGRGTRVVFTVPRVTKSMVTREDGKR
jgi:two-component system sensor histidine kinase DesK